MKEIRFQEKYISKISNTAIDFLEDKYREYSTIVFKAPTGSGKTYMISQALSQITKRSKEPLSFIWISVNSLHEQSRQNLVRYLEYERLLECITIDEIQNNIIGENEIVFINWDSLIKENNVFRLDNESDWNLQSVVSNTKEEGREIVLIIDESHRTAKTIKAQDVIKEILPKLIIEVTATPKEVSGTLIEIPLGEVIDEEMIKCEVQINPGARDIKENKDLLEVALKKRKQLKTSFESLGLNINPLLLIQIPNKKASDSTPPEDYIISLLVDFHITKTNGKLETRLSGDNIKELDELVKPNDSPIEVLIFKEAIALGWDCPRASILFLQREWKQERYVFNIQTLGRIMRMPEQKHYKGNPELNIGYVYSASDNFEIVQELATDYVSRLQMERDEDLYIKPVKLYSEFIRRKRELTRLSRDFKKCLLNASKELKTKDEINPNTKEIKKTLGIEGKVTSIDVDQIIEFENHIGIKKDIKEIVDSFSNFCGDMCSPYAKTDSTNIIKSSLRSWFKNTFNISNEDKIALIVMNRNNNSSIKQLIEVAKENYKKLPTRDEVIVPSPEWEVPEEISIFTDFGEINNSSKSIIKQTEKDRLFVKKNVNGKIDLSNPELLFIEELDKTDDDVLWWYKNSHGESKYFSIAYKKENGRYYAFYPDFIVKIKKEILIVEIKDNKDYKPENVLKLQAGKEYLQRIQHKEKLHFYILSPDDYFNFFKLLKEQNISQFKSMYEERLIRYNKSQQILIANKQEKTDKENETLELLEELDKTIKELDDEKFKNDLLKLSLDEAEENVKYLSKSFTEYIPEKEQPVKIKIPTPFNICIIGEVSDKNLLMQKLENYFIKNGIKTNEWNVTIFNNNKLQNTNVLRFLVKGQSRFNLIITGQIHHHSIKGNKKANIISELNDPKYIPHIIGSEIHDLLTPEKTLQVIDSFLRQ